MRTTARKLGLLTGALSLLVAGQAMAEDTYSESTTQKETTVVQDPMGQDLVYENEVVYEEETNIYGFSGVGIYAGGGVADFADGDMRDFTDVGGAWEVLAQFNTQGIFGVDVNYTGTAQDINALGLDSDAVLVGTMLEATGHINILPGEIVTPYVVGGAGYARYDVTNSDFNTSSVREDDQMLSVPVGAGLNFRAGDALIDLRGTYRFMFDDNLIDDPTGNVDASQDNWTATARVGFEF